MSVAHICGQETTYFHAHEFVFVFVTTVIFATYDMDASASPRKPYVVKRDKSENLDNLEVVKRSARIGRSSCYTCVTEQHKTESIKCTYANSRPIVLYL